MKPTATTIYRDSAPRRRTFRPALAVLAASSFWISAIFAPKMAASEETPTFTLEMKDGVLTPEGLA